MSARWQRVGCLLVVLYVSLTSLIAVSSGKTTTDMKVPMGACAVVLVQNVSATKAFIG